MALGAALSRSMDAPCIVFLEGELGAGKTTLVRGFLRERGYTGAVRSPTYTLVEPYPLTDETVYHLDLYRLADAEELEWIGVRDLFEDENICLVEWPEQGAGFLPEPDFHIYLGAEGEGRGLRVVAVSPRGRQVLRNLARGEQHEGA